MAILNSHTEEFKLIHEVLESHGEELRSHGEQLRSHGEQLAAHTKEFQSIHKTLQSHEKQLDFLALKVVEHDERFDRIEERMATKDDVRMIMSSLDEVLVQMKKRDQEMAMFWHAFRRHEDRIEIVECDIKKIKPKVGLR